MAGKKSDKTAKAAKTAAKPATAKRTVPKKTASASKAETSGKTSRAKAAGKTLIIVESPTKARTLSRVLGAGYLVKASVGHVKDLPPSRLGIDVDHDFALEFEVHPDKKKVLSEIRSEAKSAREVYLASDPDREGEAIAYHIAMELEALPRPPKRVLFHELTEGGIRTALSEPGEIDVRKVEAQKARRALDRIVGYTISPLLWDRVRRGLSAGRVQSVAVRLVCDREEAIARFVREEYWTIDARFRPEDVRVPPTFLSRLDRVSGEKPSFPDGDSAGQAVERIRQERFTVGEITRSDKKRNPSPPLTTSRLQQEAANRLRFSAKKTMTLAQRLYEGVDLPGHGPVGLITYMRTDSVRVSPEAAEAARRWIRENHPDALPSRVPAYKNRKGIQDAHEAIRPADVARTPESLRASIDPGRPCPCAGLSGVFVGDGPETREVRIFLGLFALSGLQGDPSDGDGTALSGQGLQGRTCPPERQAGHLLRMQPLSGMHLPVEWRAGEGPLSRLSVPLPGSGRKKVGRTCLPQRSLQPCDHRGITKLPSRSSAGDFPGRKRLFAWPNGGIP